MSGAEGVPTRINVWSVAANANNVQRVQSMWCMALRVFACLSTRENRL